MPNFHFNAVNVAVKRSQPTQYPRAICFPGQKQARKLSSSLPQPGCLITMTPEAKGSKVRQIALSAALRHRPDMIGIPKTSPARMHTKPTLQLLPFTRRQPLKSSIERDGIQAAEGTDAPISRQYLLAHVSWICSQPPLVNAGVAAESPSPLWDFDATPSADASAVWAPLLSSIDPTARFLPPGTHDSSRLQNRGQSPVSPSAYRRSRPWGAYLFFLLETEALIQFPGPSSGPI